MPDARYRQSAVWSFGEAAINDWFRQRLYPEDAEASL